MGSKYDEPTTDEYLLIRRMMRAEKTIKEIHAALGWECSTGATRDRLARYGLRVITRKFAHDGHRTKIMSDYDRSGKTRLPNLADSNTDS